MKKIYLKQCLCVILLVTLGMALLSCKRNVASASGGASKVVDVKTEPLHFRQVQDTVGLDGTVAPVQQANLVARVEGNLERILFTDGQRVHRDQLLFSIERGPYEQQVKLNQAKVDEAKAEYMRQGLMMSENATSQANFDSSKSSLEQALANLELAKINLGYTQVRAPFDGVISRRVVDTGNYVGATAGGTVLGTIMTLSPAYVNAAIGESEALRIRRASGYSSSGLAPGQAKVRAQLQDGEELDEIGVLDFVDHQLNSSSGTLAVRGRFNNASGQLVAGIYAKLQIDLGQPRRALTLSRDVIGSDQQGEFVWIIDNDNVAHRRTIKTAPLAGEDREVLKGAFANEEVVVAGGGKLAEGQVVHRTDEATGAQP